MLVLGRKNGEQIIIRTDERILAVVTILKTPENKKQVRVGVDALGDVHIERFEIAPEDIKEKAKKLTFEGKLQEKLQEKLQVVSANDLNEGN